MKPIVKTALVLALLLTSLPVVDLNAQEITTFILVRHAEKADDGTDDPPLNEEGEVRAVSLKNHLEKTDISVIYSTAYKRTLHTIEKIADHNDLMVYEYDPHAGNLVEEMLQKHEGETILISGHSNTLYLLLNQFTGADDFEQLDESDYENLYIVSVTEIGQAKVIHLTY